MDSSTQKQPRVCILLEGYSPNVGGMETAARNMVAGLRARGIPVLVVTRRINAAWPKVEVVDGATVHRLPPSSPSSRARWALLFNFVPALIRLRREYDVILCPGFRTLGIAAVLVGKALGKAVVLKAESRGEMSGEFFAGGLETVRLKRTSWLVRPFMALRNRILSRADALVSLSSEMTAEFRAAGAPEEKTHVIPQSADVARFRPVSPEEKKALRRRLGLPENALIVIFSGRLVSYKGLPVLVRVWEDLAPKHPGAKLVFAGSGSADIYNWEAELKQFVADRHLQDSVILTGAVNNVHEYLQAADVFAFPTENEAFPLALLEAMACGLPAVGTTIGGIKDVIRDGRNGLLMEPGNADQLRAAIEKLMGDPGLRESLGREALATVRRDYTSEMVTDRYITVLERCFDAARKAS